MIVADRHCFANLHRVLDAFVALVVGRQLRDDADDLGVVLGEQVVQYAVGCEFLLVTGDSRLVELLQLS